MIVNQDEANAFADSIQEASKRVWVQYCVSVLAGYAVRHQEDINVDVDLLLMAKVFFAIGREDEVVEKVLSGSYSSFDEVPHLF